MSTLFSTLRLWVVRRTDTVYILAPGETGLPEPIDQHAAIVRARYLSPDGISQQLESGNIYLDTPNGSLLVRLGDSEAPPETTALLFAYESKETIQCRIGQRAHTLEADLYLAATKSGIWVWGSDLQQGKHGYFQIGMLGQANLWRIRRAEADFANRWVFTIAPITPSNGLPTLELSSVKNAEIRQQIDQHWREFVEVYTRQLPLRSVNAARDLCEYVLYDVLSRRDELPRKHNFGDLLGRLFEVLEKGSQNWPFTMMHFHLMQKIRMLHGSIHIGKVARDGAISPELALSVGTDLVEILTAAGLANNTKRMAV